MTAWEILNHPAVWILMAALGFLLKDIFFQIKEGRTYKAEIIALKARVQRLEEDQSKMDQISDIVIRLEEQMKHVSENLREVKQQLIRGSKVVDQSNA